jgi:predicted phage terminase large subunit-like protein
VIGVSPERDLFILENMAGYWSASKQVDMMFLLQDKYNCRIVGAERNAAYIYLEKLVSERQREAGRIFELRPINTYNEQKVARAQVVPPFIKNGMLKFPRTRDGQELINQMKTFPLGRWTDRVDSVVLFFSRDMNIMEGLQKEFYVPTEHDPDFMPLMTQEQIDQVMQGKEESLSLRLN